MANYGAIVAPDSIGAFWGTNLASATVSASSPSLTSTLGGATVTIKDNAGNSANALLYMVSSGQINFVIPAGVALGQGTVTVNGSGSNATAKILISNVAPGIFTANGNAKGVAAAQILRVRSDGTTALETTAGGAAGNYTATPISFGTSGDRLYLMLYGTGIRRHSMNPVTATVNGVAVPVLYAGAQSQFPGLDQINIGPLPNSLAGSGTVNVNIYVDGVPANPVQIAFQ